MTEKPKKPLPPMPKLPPPKYTARPNLLMRIGSWFFERRTGK
ncbi:hypothetical protein [Methylobacterium sp. E-005]|nr:hypothetical protein [Methylobacterium sp. E-005]